MKIYVSVGTHEQPFQRLLDAVASAIASAEGNEWLVQYGVGKWAAADSSVRAVAYLSGEEVTEALSWADVLVSQASPGNSFGALDAGVWPIVLGRRKALGEHVDDHQVRFAAALADMGLATDLGKEGRLAEVLRQESRRDPGERLRVIQDAMAASEERRRVFREQAWPLILGSGKKRS